LNFMQDHVKGFHNFHPIYSLEFAVMNPI